jgi:hypothetical protein
MPHLAVYVGLLHRAEQTLADSFRVVADGHADEPDVLTTCRHLAGTSDEHVTALAPVADRYGEQARGEGVEEPERLHADGLGQVRSGPVGLLRDLQDLYVLASLVQSSWTVVEQAAQGARDRELIGIANSCSAGTSRQLTWLTTRIKAAAPQALLVAS